MQAARLPLQRDYFGANEAAISSRRRSPGSGWQSYIGLIKATSRHTLKRDG
jgi:hypothetical protein